jgi:hydrogenase 3 maturation protease
VLNQAKNIEDALRDWLESAKRIVVVGVGNELRRDDFVGVEVVRRLKGKVPKNVMIIESETVPESFLEPITQFNPTHVLLIDAGFVDLKPGQMKMADSRNALSPAPAVSTHALPLRIFCDYLVEATGTKIMLIVIQPGTTDFGEGLTKEVKKTAERLAETLTRITRHQYTTLPHSPKSATSCQPK